MSAAPAHYIRSIQTSFTAAHPPATWAASINSHNQNTYHHHLAYQPPAGPTTTTPHHGRRRSASIRLAAPPQIKFDPFADEPPVLTAAAPPSNYPHIHHPSSRTHHPIYAHPGASVSAPSVPYTIQIPAAAPTEIQRYHTPTTSRRFGFPSSTSLPNPARSAPAAPAASSGFPSHNRSTGVTRSSFGSTTTGKTAPPPPQSTTTATNATRMTGALSGPNISKLVAGILLNRVHVVGKPMRRRPVPAGERPREYVKSGLSNLVAVDA